MSHHVRVNGVLGLGLEWAAIIQHLIFPETPRADDPGARVVLAEALRNETRPTVAEWVLA